MPRPVVEIHQSILSQIITPNDPEQSVCLVGLNCLAREDYKIGSFSANPANLSPTGNYNIAVDESGVIVNSDIDLGGSTVSGDISVKLSNVKEIVGSSNTVTNFGVSGKLGVNTALLSSAADITDDSEHFLNVKAPTSLKNRLVIQSGSGTLDLASGAVSRSPAYSSTTVSAIASIALNSTVIKLSTASGKTFKVIAKDSSTLYIYGADNASEDFLRGDTGLTSITATVVVSGSDVNIAGFKFKLLSAVDEEIQILDYDADTKTATLNSEIRFMSGLHSDTNAACIVSKRTTAEYTVAETDASNKLVVTLVASGDGTISIPYARFIANNIASCDVLATYSVALTGYSDRIHTLDSESVSSLGVPSLQNQLALAARVALLNAGVTTVGVLALDITPESGSIIAKSLSEAYTNALSIVNADSSVYAICPLTTDISTITEYKLAAESMSTPSKGKFRIVIGSSEGAPANDYIVGSLKSLEITGTIASGDLTDQSKNFRSIASKVMDGDLVTAVSSTGVVYTGVVSSVSISSLGINWDTGVDPANGTYSYTVYRSISGISGKSRQIEILKSILTPIQSNRLAMVFPGSCTVSVLGKTYSGADAYYLAAAVTGLIAGFEPHRPKNNIGILGVTALSGSNIGRFSEDEIDEISDAGYMVFVQDSIASAPYCVHQVMTRYQSYKGIQELTELSVINNFDFVSRFFKEILQPYVGTHNIVPQTLGSIRASLEGGIASLRGRAKPQIGSALISGTVDVLRQASYDSGTVEVKLSVILPKVLNKLVVELVSA